MLREFPTTFYKVVTTLEKGVEELIFKVNKDPGYQVVGDLGIE